jgi:hypothetical protein
MLLPLRTVRGMCVHARIQVLYDMVRYDVMPCHAIVTISLSKHRPTMSNVIYIMTSIFRHLICASREVAVVVDMSKLFEHVCGHE